MDEADRMVHLGFENDLTFILDALPADMMEGEDRGDYMDIDGETVIKKGRTRVTTLFSATMPPAVERLAKKYLKRPAVITIGEAGRAVDTVDQKVEFVNGDEKKKCVLNPFKFSLLMQFFFLPQAEATRNSQQWNVFTSHHRLRQPKEDCRYGGKGPPKGRGALGRVSFINSILTIFPVECSYLAFREEPRTTRGVTTISTQRRIRHSRCYRPCWSWYRRTRRQSCHQLPDG